MNIFINKYPDQEFEISGDEYQHIKAQRKRVGDQINFIPPTGSTFIVGKICSLNKRSVSIVRIGIKDKPSKHLPKITLYQAIAKKQKMELILQKATELGVDRIIPVITQNIVPKVDKGNVVRWEKIVKEAAMQSRRFDKPQIEDAMKLTVINGGEGVVCLAEHSAMTSFKNYLSGKEKIEEISIIIGAEGGFNKDELMLLKDQGVTLASFGSNILRTETAAISAIGVLRWFYD